ncbi:hypothetical protein AGABI1DRAFT_134387 [Agaricus bisporus var. burnettii JB137-S8]|uniref:Uncharacterized protein n=1 Tax=Agaricus bisporus var. burnettii (strain JB137-S8 / ATCC MYA-4627 / FGSC 10392) TaxID=597362 RepID=K5WSD2_AGABU|nr:uncharacterized protein AGABI1DRAFT_134387 [Agaricus bisporus var. burnettii JB137-S8]EKM73623.1 hypothetical protein AGABI1DRAFT_134387 [Agaricus bisporus var. burnettii JB137-S8]
MTSPIFYTDNISDRLFLENSFPSLRNNVVAIDKYADLDPFEVSITVGNKTLPMFCTF